MKSRIFPQTLKSLFILILFINNSKADNAPLNLNPSENLFQTTVKSKASFESLYEDTLLPKKNVDFDYLRSDTLMNISRANVFPSQNYGYPSGTLISNFGGRTADDTEATTLGIPINSPQGGGADLSIYPAFLWKNAETSPQGISSKIQFKLWTREILENNPCDSIHSQFLITNNRDLQSYSLGLKAQDLALNVGLNAGRQDGPAGSLSYSLLRSQTSQILFHIIATKQDGQSPGSITYPSPDTRKKTWRIMPVIEGHTEVSDDLTLASTLFADLQELQFIDPTYTTDDRIQQFGIENALLYQNYTLGFTVKSLHYYSSTFHEINETPLEARLSRDFNKEEALSSKLTVTGNYTHQTGLIGGGKVATRYTPSNLSLNPLNPSFFFAELNSIPKMPTLISRYYQIPYFFTGNPNLKPERVNAFLMGYEGHAGEWSSTSTLKAEYRNQIQVNTSDSVMNKGNATLLYLQEELVAPLVRHFKLKSNTLLSTSKLQDSNLPYPDLPAFVQVLGLNIIPFDELELNLLGKYNGPSVASDGRFHPNYTLIDFSTQYQINSHFSISGGVDNIFDQRAQVLLDYPLTGRIAYAAIKASF